MEMTTVIINAQVEGFHTWPEARTALPEVGFLSDIHRHIFHITCEKAVYHDNRDIEFILFKREVTKYIYEKWGSPAQFGSMSCEAICRDLMLKFELESCQVMEDNENGSRIRKTK